MLKKILGWRFISKVFPTNARRKYDFDISEETNVDNINEIVRMSKANDNFLYLYYHKNQLNVLDRCRIVHSLHETDFPDLRLYLLKTKDFIPFTFLIMKRHFFIIFFLLFFTIKFKNKLKEMILDSLTELNPFKNQKPDVKFTDLVGIEEFKEELEDIVSYMSNRKLFLKSGAIIPKGVLLIGPPGCGKTQLARAIAGETDLDFYSISASEFVQPYVGQGPRVIKDLFKKARKKKGAIIFIDEIDSLQSRNQFVTSANSNLNQLLTEMDGFKSSDNILVVAATNREDALDKALTRAGRFDLKIAIRLPNNDNRLKILDYYLGKISHGKVDKEKVARKTVGFSPAEIKNLVNLAILNAIKEKRQKAEEQDFVYAFERIKLGIKANDSITNDDIRSKAALREATKAVLATKDPLLPDVDKISLNSFGEDNFGKVIMIDKTDRTNYTKEELLLRLELMLSSKASEEIFLEPNEYSSLTLTDLENARSLAARYVMQFAMCEEFSLVSIDKKYLSEDQKYKAEEKAQEILNQVYNSVKQKIVKEKDVIQKVKEKLIEKEELVNKDITMLMGGK